MHDEDSDYFDEAVLKLKSVARVGQRIEAAQVQLMNLDKVAEKAGARWPQISGRVRIGTLGFLAGRLDKADIVMPCGDGFLVIFARLDETAARKRVAELENELTAFYLGEEGLTELTARMRHSSMSETDIVAMAAPPKPAMTSDTAHTVVFAPVWSAQAQVIACYFQVPFYVEDGCFEFGYQREYRVHGTYDFRDFLDLDLSILEQCLAVADRHVASGARSVLGVSVHASTLRRAQARTVYMKRLMAAPALVASRLLVKIAELELGAPQGQITEMTRPLRGLVAQTALEFHHRERPPIDLKLFGCGLAGFHLPRHQGSITVAQQQGLLQSIVAWRAALTPHGMKLFVDGFSSVDFLRRASPSIHFASSNRLWPVQAQPAGVRSAPLPAASVTMALPEAV